MGKKRHGSHRKPPPGKTRAPVQWLIIGAVVLASAALIAIAVARSGGPQTVGAATAWAHLGTADVHSLVFDPDDAQHLLFGHHGGLLETTDGGRTWQPTALHGADAMNVGRPSGGFFQVAGHDVYMETTDGGQSWQDVPNDLPGLDLHAFATDPADPSRAWAFAVGFGLFETTDRGRAWERRQAGNWGALTAFVENGLTVLVGVGGSGLGRSEDGGRTWTSLAPPDGQLVSLAASVDGSALYAATTTGVRRSSDRGRTWTATEFGTVAMTVAVSAQHGNVVAVVDDQTRFFRSADGGRSWPGP